MLEQCAKDGVSSTMLPKHPQVRLASEALQLTLL